MILIRSNLVSRLELFTRQAYWQFNHRTHKQPVHRMRMLLRGALHSDIREHVRRDPQAVPADYRGWPNPWGA